MKHETILLLSLIVVVMAVILFGSSASITGLAKGGKPGGGKPKTQCADGIDNDGDGYCDFLWKKTKCVDGSTPGDPDCASLDDNKEEADCIPVPERCDGFDNNCNGQIDEGLPVECGSASQCGESGWTGEPYCAADDNLHRDWIEYQCNFPGTCSSSCSSQVTDYVYEWCANGCSGGQCLPDHVCGDGTCDADESCSSCAEDCGLCAYCGDGYCDYDEDCQNCQVDCGICDSCADTDGGYYVYTRGTVSGYINGTYYTETDFCTAGDLLVEYWCYGNQWTNYVHDCAINSSAGCLNGACLGP